jgi:hypothetical protein
MREPGGRANGQTMTESNLVELYGELSGVEPAKRE